MKVIKSETVVRLTEEDILALLNETAGINALKVIKITQTKHANTDKAPLRSWDIIVS